MKTASPQNSWIRLVSAAGIVAGYFLMARLGSLFAATPYGASPIWPAAGFATWAVLFHGPGLAPWIWAATLMFMRSTQTPWFAAIVVAFGNTLNPLLAHRFRHWIHGGHEWLTAPPFSEKGLQIGDFSTAQFLRFVVGAAILPATLSATIGMSALGKFSQAPLAAWAGWLIGDTLGSFLFGGFLLLATQESPRKHANGLGATRIGEEVVVQLLTTGFTVFIFSDLVIPLDQSIQLKYAVMPLLAWSAVRLPLRSTWLASTGAALITPIFLYELASDRPPPSGGWAFVIPSVQGYILLTCGTGLLLAYAVEDRRKSLEAEKLARREAEAAVATRDEFLSLAAHELRTPLTPLTIQLQILRRNTESAKMRGIDLAVKQAEKLGRLVDDLLDASRITRGELKIEKAPLELSEAISEFLENRGRVLESAGCTMQTRIQPGIRIYGDRHRIEQVIDNLLTNAARYAPGSLVEVGLETDPLTSMAVLTFRDHGPGFPPESRPRLFEKYQRFHSSTAHGGLGIGLFLSRQIIRAHGGDIALESLPSGETGASFRISIPMMGNDGPPA